MLLLWATRDIMITVCLIPLLFMLLNSCNSLSGNFVLCRYHMLLNSCISLNECTIFLFLGMSSVTPRIRALHLSNITATYKINLLSWPVCSTTQNLVRHNKYSKFSRYIYICQEIQKIASCSISLKTNCHQVQCNWQKCC